MLIFLIGLTVSMRVHDKLYAQHAHANRGGVANKHKAASAEKLYKLAALTKAFDKSFSGVSPNF